MKKENTQRRIGVACVSVEGGSKGGFVKGDGKSTCGRRGGRGGGRERVDRGSDEGEKA